MKKCKKIIWKLIRFLSLFFILLLIHFIIFFQILTINEVHQTNQEIIFDQFFSIHSNQENQTANLQWSIAIPKINVLAQIEEGSSLSVLKNYVGHVEGTGTVNSNICLAAHTNTADYPFGKFYFDQLNQLEQGDEIIYTYFDLSKQFLVKEMKTVDETDLSILISSQNTKLTLITCIKGQRNKRLCVICEEKN